MKQLLLLISTILLATSSFGESPISKNLSDKSFGSAWQAQQFIHPTHGKNDLTIVYGGADISHRPLATPIAAA
ncbi:MAG: hypothetical protein A3F11_06295 [Gammaproteobacteria bacterium RIFCSPHIGHO2_12_FULL_37_14]|nr:MAG: hypothetical protein A3F11_06295 [Gammaproteobacteria bacterium RIFCSPHIGHO2_12_FULL_37_14]